MIINRVNLLASIKVQFYVQEVWPMSRYTAGKSVIQELIVFYVNLQTLYVGYPLCTLVKVLYTGREPTGTLGSRPSRKLLMVPK